MRQGGYSFTPTEARSPDPTFKKLSSAPGLQTVSSSQIFSPSHPSRKWVQPRGAKSLLFPSPLFSSPQPQSPKHTYVTKRPFRLVWRLRKTDRALPRKMSPAMRALFIDPVLGTPMSQKTRLRDAGGMKTSRL